MGGVFNNSDALRVDYSAEYDATIIKETKGTYVLDCRAKTTSVGYDNLKMEVDRKTMVPTTIACHAASGMLIRSLYYKSIKDFGVISFGHRSLKRTAPCMKDINP